MNTRALRQNGLKWVIFQRSKRFSATLACAITFWVAPVWGEIRETVEAIRTIREEDSVDCLKSRRPAPIAGGAWFLRHDLGFGINSAQVGTSGIKELNDSLRTAQLHPLYLGVEVATVVGHADKTEREPADLGIRRGNAAAQLVDTLTKTKGHTYVESKGSKQPAWASDTPSNRLKNARVEVEILLMKRPCPSDKVRYTD